MNEFKVTCPDENSTKLVASKIAGHLEGGEFIELIGDVGSGKTTFVKGLAKGLACEDSVSSPSFALKNIYKGRLNINHFDLYRLDQPGLISHEIEDSIKDDKSVTVIEWAGIFNGVLPRDRIVINFVSPTENSRELTVKFPVKESATK